MKPETFNIEELINSLQGSCSTIEEKLPEGMSWEDLTAEDHAKIDSEIFRCAECDWWYEVSDMSENEEEGEQYCKNCRPENEED